MDWQSVIVTVRLAACTTGLLLVLGLPLGYWLASTRWRGRFLIEAFLALPLVLPPTVLGFYLLVAMSPSGPVGTWTGRFPFTFAGILLGSVVFNLPFAVRPFTSSFAAVDRRLVEASWCLGVSRWGTLRRVVWPLAWPGILTGLVLTFAHTVGEFGVVLMIGGNIPGVTRTLSISIYDSVQALDYAAAHRTAVVMLLFSFGVLSAVFVLQRRVLPL